jgi:hypothetical protein
MNLLRDKTKYKRQDNSYWYDRYLVLGKHLWDWFRLCPTTFKVTLSQDFPNPCRNDEFRSGFTPANYTIGDKNWWSWLCETNLPGKVKVSFYFHGWYATWMPVHPDEGISERAVLYISFSSKAAAMMFKLKFASPELETIFPG